jgi:uncharacterized RDD family membrane protein YckC
LPLAGFGRRLVAVIIDSVITGVVLLAIGVPVAFLCLRVAQNIDPGDTVSSQTDPAQVFSAVAPVILLEFGFYALILAVYYVYYVELFYKSGQTVGKRVMRIRVIPLDPSARLTRGKAATRYLLQCVAPMFVGFLPLLDGLWQLWDKPYQQTLHDKAAQTVVIKVSV